MYIYTFEKRIRFDQETVYLKDFHVSAANIEEAEHKAIQLIDQDVPGWVRFAENACVLGKLIGVKLEEKSRCQPLENQLN